MGLFEAIGWLGAITYIVAYFFLSIRVLKASRMLYHILNAIGGLCLVINALHLKDNPTFFVNLIWMAIALFTTFRIGQKSNQNQAKSQ